LAGEKSGNLEEVLTRYVAFQRMSLSFRKKLVASLIYPALLVIGVVVLMSVLVTYVVPKFADLYKDLNQPLPAITEFTIAFALNVKSYIPVILGALAVGGFLLWRWAKTPKGGELLDRFKLHIPLYGSIWLRFQVAMFSRMLSTLLSGGLPLVQAMETASLSMQSRLLSLNIDEARQKVREGQALAHSLEETKIFPELAVEMVEVGESTGALPAMLISVAEFFEEDVQNALAAAMALIEPAILIIMGLVVGFILISLYMPIFSIGASGALG
jgi:type IV pilus assembly protein PilC